MLYFNDIIKFEDFDFDNILIDEKSYQNILLFDILYRTLAGAKTLLIRFNKIDWLIRVWNGTII